MSTPVHDPVVQATAVALAAGRLAIGAGLWLAPRQTLAALGFGESDERALTLARIGATRDLVLGLWQLGSLNDPSELRRASVAGAATDGGDAVTFALALRSGEDRGAALRGLAAAGSATVAGIWLARRLGQT